MFSDYVAQVYPFKDNIFKIRFINKGVSTAAEYVNYDDMPKFIKKQIDKGYRFVFYHHVEDSLKNILIPFDESFDSKKKVIQLEFAF